MNNAQRLESYRKQTKSRWLTSKQYRRILKHIRRGDYTAFCD